MNIRLELCNDIYFDDCVTALRNSELGNRYFPDDISAVNAVKEGINAETLYVALCEDEFAGFAYYIPHGAFHAFPYIHLLVIKQSLRGSGIGTEVLRQVEEKAGGKKIFLVVADFNPDGKRFYEKNGYTQVGVIDSLYRQGITEYLMMKQRV